MRSVKVVVNITLLIVLLVFIYPLIAGLGTYKTNSDSFQYDLVDSDNTFCETGIKPEIEIVKLIDATLLSVTDMPEDADGNGYYDFIRFDAQIEVFSAGVYEIRIELRIPYMLSAYASVENLLRASCQPFSPSSRAHSGFSINRIIHAASISGPPR